MAGNRFLDSNVLLYLLESNDPRTAVALNVLDGGGVISVQVLNEFANVASKKLRFTPPRIVEALALIRECCDVVPLDVAAHDRAMELFLSTNFGVYDCNIIAAAELADCDILYTEDMNHGQRVGRVMICNPFIAT